MTKEMILDEIINLITIHKESLLNESFLSSIIGKATVQIIKNHWIFKKLEDDESLREWIHISLEKIFGEDIHKISKNLNLRW